SFWVVPYIVKGRVIVRRVSFYKFYLCRLLMITHWTFDGRTASDDYSAFNDVWDNPEGGMHQYLHRFLTSSDATFQHIAVWTIVQLLESGGSLLVSFLIPLDC